MVAFPIKVALAVPAYGSKLDVGHMGMWFALGAVMAATQDKLQLVSLANYHVNGIDHARNVITADALRVGAEWLLMVDADTFHYQGLDAIGDNGVDILQMIVDGARQDAAMIAAPVRLRGQGTEHGRLNVQLHVKADLFRRADDEELIGKVVEVDRIGAAFVAINLDFLRRHIPRPPWFRMIHDVDTEGRPTVKVGEDWYFCDLVRSFGGRVLCDGRFVPDHVEGRRVVAPRQG